MAQAVNALSDTIGKSVRSSQRRPHNPAKTMISFGRDPILRKTPLRHGQLSPVTGGRDTVKDCIALKPSEVWRTPQPLVVQSRHLVARI